MTKNREFINNTFILFLGKFSTQLVIFLLLPLYTHFLSAADFGYVDLVITYITLLIPIFILRFDSAAFIFLLEVRDKKKEKAKVLSNILISLLLQVLFVIIISLLIGLIFNIRHFEYIILNIIFVMMTTVLLQVARGLKKTMQFAIGSTIAAGTTLALNLILIVFLNIGAEAIYLSAAIAGLLCSLYLIISCKLKFGFKEFNKPLQKDLLKFALPMIPNSLSWWLMTASNRTIITFMLGAATNGIFAVSVKLANIISSIFGVVAMSWQETVALHIDEADAKEYISKTINTILRVFITVSLLLIAGMPFVFPIIIGYEYSGAYPLIPLLLIATIFNVFAGLTGGIYVAKKKTNEVAKTAIYAAVIGVVIHLMLIDFFGIYAAAISAILSYFIMAFHRYIDIQKYLKVKLETATINLFVIGLSLSLIFYYYNHLFTNILSLIIIISLSVIYNLDLIKDIYQSKIINEGGLLMKKLLNAKLILALLISIFMIGSITNIVLMGIIPARIILMGSLVITLISAGLFLIVFKFKNKIIKAFSWLLLAGLSIALLLSNLFILQVDSLISNITRNERQTIRYVFVAKTANANQIRNSDFLEIASLTLNEEAMVEAKKQLKEKTDFNYQTADNVLDAFYLLTEGEVEGIFLENVFLEILEDVESELLEDVEIIWTIDVRVDANDIRREVDIRIDPFVVFISGIDTHGSINTRARSDLNIIVVVNPRRKEVLTVHIPRDYFVYFERLGARDKLTHAGIFGMETLVRTVEDFMEVDINYYLRTNFTTLIGVVDVLGEIEVELDFLISHRDHNFHRGINRLNGEQALLLTRIRRGLPGGDRTRGMHQQRVLEAIIHRAASTEIIRHHSSILQIVGDSFITNATDQEIRQMISFQLNDMSGWRIESISVDGHGVMAPSPLIPGRNVWMMEPNMNTVRHAKERINYYLEQ